VALCRGFMPWLYAVALRLPTQTSYNAIEEVQNSIPSPLRTRQLIDVISSK